MSLPQDRTGGGGGRIMPGTGGAGRLYSNSTGGAIFLSGAGGSAGAVGANGVWYQSFNGGPAGGGGGWGARGGAGIDGASAPSTQYGTGGKAVNLNGYTITWQGFFSNNFSNQVFGAIS